MGIEVVAKYDESGTLGFFEKDARLCCKRDVNNARFLQDNLINATEAERENVIRLCTPNADGKEGASFEEVLEYIKWL